MLTFLRKLRSSLIPGNKVTKYLLYATGEIILVIVGILIALNINNRNEADKELQRVDDILLQIAQNLEGDIENSHLVIRYYSRIDSVIQTLLSKELERSDFVTKNNEYTEIPSLYRSFNFYNTSTESYDLLNQNINSIPPEYDELMKRFAELYNVYRRNVEFNNQAVSDFVLKVYHNESEQYDWHRLDSFKESSLDYFLNDFRFKNTIYDYSFSTMQAFIPGALAYRRRAIICYKMIHELLERPLPRKGFLLDEDEARLIIGSYQSTDGPMSVKIGISNQELLYQLESEDGTVESQLMNPISANVFFTSNVGLLGNLIEFQNDSTGAYHQMIVKQGREYHVLDRQ